MKSKYIIIDEMGLELPIVFSHVIDHKTVANGFCKVVSAGFCSTDMYEGYYDSVWGESVGLKIKSRGEQDKEILNLFLERD